MNQEMSTFAKTILEQKYCHTKEDGTKETWEEVASRVVDNVLAVIEISDEVKAKLKRAITERKFIPGGRYLFAAGNDYHQTQNCVMFKAEDSREGWSDLLYKISMSLMSGAGIGVVYNDIRAEGKIIKRTGGTATGPLALMQMVNECGRGIMNGGNRRAAIWSGLLWSHPDIHKFIVMKNWSEEVRDLKEKDFNFPATMDMTNISVILDDEFFTAFKDEHHSNHSLAQSVYWATIKQMLKTSEPGFSIDVGENEGENLRNAPLSGNTQVLIKDQDTSSVYLGKYIPIIDIVGQEVEIWTGVRWAPTVFKKTKENTETIKITFSDPTSLEIRSIVCDPEHEFFKGDKTKVPADKLQRGDKLLSSNVEFWKPSNNAWREIWYNHLSVIGRHNHYYPIPSWEKEQLGVNETKYFLVRSIEKDINQDVYCCDVKVPEHCFMAEGVLVSNCTEVSSRDDSDICNLGSLNLARISSIEEMKELVELGIIFLLAGTIYSDVPTDKINQIRIKNRRLGLGLMGIHEWLISRGKKYDIDSELQAYLEIYKTSTEIAHKYAEKWNLSKPIKTRAIAPTGTIGIIAETTTGIEPIFCVSYKRRYLKHKSWNYQYVIDPTAKKLIDQGINSEHIEDAYSLSSDVERRVAFQAWVQQYVDHSISSTINLPPWGSEFNNESTMITFGSMLLKYLPKLRGLTVYADGSRGGQPLTPIKYSTASKHIGEVFVETEKVVYESADVCDISKGGSCGS